MGDGCWVLVEAIESNGAQQYLATAGVGTIGLVDGDRVDTTNLQRQVIFFDVGIRVDDPGTRPVYRRALRQLA